MWNCPTSIFPSPAWRIFFCTTREGACGNELESVLCHAWARCSCRSPQHHSHAAADICSAADVCFHLWQSDGRQRAYAPILQEPVAPRHHGLTMIGTGIWAVAMPLIGEFQFTREI